jgi:adenylate cyclase
VPFLASSVPGLVAWLHDTVHVPDGGRSFTNGLVTRMRELGLPLWRMSLSLLTKHPEVLWRTLQWSEGGEVTAFDRSHRLFLEPFFTSSPVARLLAGSPPIRVRLDADELRFPICRDLRDQGGTDYYAQGLAFTNGEISYISWATRDRSGFPDESLHALDAIGPSLARRMELESAYHGTQTLLEVYLGRNAARRVFEGAFHRGSGEIIRAVIWFCDLRDFTAMSDRMAVQEVVEMLDAYFDCVAGAVADRGGEVLKFIGDAILAIFPVQADATPACREALDAAVDALEAVERLNERRSGKPALSVGVALHLGELMYGNIGSAQRLDFTVISSSVNETTRLEELCKVLKVPLMLSDAFVRSLGRDDVVDLGEHSLKGVSSKVRVFTLDRLWPPA